jgi:hypothetical protein
MKTKTVHTFPTQPYPICFHVSTSSSSQSWILPFVPIVEDDGKVAVSHLPIVTLPTANSVVPGKWICLLFHVV